MSGQDIVNRVNGTSFVSGENKKKKIRGINTLALSRTKNAILLNDNFDKLFHALNGNFSKLNLTDFSLLISTREQLYDIFHSNLTDLIINDGTYLIISNRNCSCNNGLKMFENDLGHHDRVVLCDECNSHELVMFGCRNDNFDLCADCMFNTKNNNNNNNNNNGNPNRRNINSRRPRRLRRGMLPVPATTTTLTTPTTPTTPTTGATAIPILMAFPITGNDTTNNNTAGAASGASAPGMREETKTIDLLDLDENENLIDRIIDRERVMNVKTLKINITNALKHGAVTSRGSSMKQLWNLFEKIGILSSIETLIINCKRHKFCWITRHNNTRVRSRNDETRIGRGFLEKGLLENKLPLLKSLRFTLSAKKISYICDQLVKIRDTILSHRNLNQIVIRWGSIREEKIELGDGTGTGIGGTDKDKDKYKVKYNYNNNNYNQVTKRQTQESENETKNITLHDSTSVSMDGNGNGNVSGISDGSNSVTPVVKWRLIADPMTICDGNSGWSLSFESDYNPLIFSAVEIDTDLAQESMKLVANFLVGFMNDIVDRRILLKNDQTKENIKGKSESNSKTPTAGLCGSSTVISVLNIVRNV